MRGFLFVCILPPAVREPARSSAAFYCGLVLVVAPADPGADHAADEAGGDAGGSGGEPAGEDADGSLLLQCGADAFGQQVAEALATLPETPVERWG